MHLSFKDMHIKYFPDTVVHTFKTTTIQNYTSKQHLVFAKLFTISE